MPAKPKSPDSDSVNLSALAREYGIQRITLRKWRDEENIDITNPAAVAERAARKHKSEDVPDLATAKLRKLTLEADRIQLALDIERGVYVPAETQRAAGEQLGNLIKQTFLRMSADLTPILTGRPSPEVKKELDRYARAKLTELSLYQGHIKIEAE
jgi:hypothetical protein